jgi:chromosome segregation ATPase
MTQEIERLNNVIRSKTEDIAKLQERCRDMEDQVAFLKSHETKLIESQRTIDSLTITINEFKRNVQNEQDKARAIDGRARELETHLFSSTQEKEKLATLLKQKGFEYDELRNKFSRLEQESYRLLEIEAAYREAKVQISHFRIK